MAQLEVHTNNKRIGPYISARMSGLTCTNVSTTAVYASICQGKERIFAMCLSRFSASCFACISEANFHTSSEQPLVFQALLESILGGLERLL
jgi:hypothetical protein